MKKSRMTLMILMGFFWFSMLTSEVYAQPAANTTETGDQFAFDLYSRLSSASGNVFFSPYSLSSALGMAYEGARHQTADQMRMVLDLPSDGGTQQKEVSGFMHTANGLWVEKTFPLKENYIKLVEDIYSGEARNMDFGADPDGSRLTINHWVSEQTKNHINDLLPPGSIDASTRLVLTNAVYFKEKWACPFPKGSTKQDTFWISPTSSVQTAMMGLEGQSFRYTENNVEQVVELPYQGNDLSMLIILPYGKDIRKAEESISAPVLKQWDAQMDRLVMNVYMPKFKFSSDYLMKDTLIEMGMKLAFDKQSADFSGMADLKPAQHLYLDQVYHKAWIEVDEEGTQAAAATGVVVATLAIRVPKIFRADHPFIFVVRENKTGHILFMGRVSNPVVP